jgi:hypothetical protein
MALTSLRLTTQERRVFRHAEQYLFTQRDAGREGNSG